MTSPTHFAIPADLAQRILAYLAGRPYAEVHTLIPPLQEIDPVKPPKRKEPT